MLLSLQKKRPNAEVFRLSDENDARARLELLALSSGLFEDKHIISLEYVTQTEEMREKLRILTPAIATSPHVCIVLEESFDVATKKILQKHASEMREFDTKKEIQKRFDVFALTDAILNRDRKNAWVILQKALREKLSAEEIHGVLWWQFKTLLLVKRGDTEGLKPFVIKKTRSALPRFSEMEIQNFLDKLLRAYHESRANGPSLDIALEQFVLEL
jgi:DNA polymerase III delta subunit